MKEKKPRGRPPKYPMLEPLNVDMDTLAEVISGPASSSREAT